MTDIDREFVEHLQALAGDRCECSRSKCHLGQGRCPEALVDAPGLAQWVAFRTAVSPDGKAVSSYFIALCGACAAKTRSTIEIGPRSGS